MTKRVMVMAIVMWGTSAARADKPSLAAGKKAVNAWQKAMVNGQNAKPPNFDAAAKLTMVPFHVVVIGDNQCEQTAEDAGKLAAALACANNGPGVNALKPYTPKALKKMPMLKEYTAEIEKLAKTHLMLLRDEDGIDVSEFAIIAVSADGKILKVAAIFGGTFTR